MVAGGPQNVQLSSGTGILPVFHGRDAHAMRVFQEPLTWQRAALWRQPLAFFILENFVNDVVSHQ
jgi:hypothetical protein